jgi:glutamine synthetase
VRRLGKPPAGWTRADLTRYCLEAGVRVVNFRYPSLDGKLRELRLPVNDRAYLERILAAGERVDGSSLFPGLFPTGASDLYAVPVYRWAFPNPWAADELDIVCRFADDKGRPSRLTPDNVVAAAADRFHTATKAKLLALAELEFYLVLDRGDHRFSGKAQRHYHQSSPYLHGRAIADEILRQVTAATGGVKYCHSEVGYIDRIESAEPELDGRRVEQYELEMRLMPIEDLACWLTVARWLIREVAARHGASVTFVPKLDQGTAGSGLHLHLAVERDGRNTVGRRKDGALSTDGLGLVGGLLEWAEPLTAFGNTVTGSYLRLVPGQEAPTRVCWGRRDRAALVRVPLDFSTGKRLDQAMNPGEPGEYPNGLGRPTVEYRSPDGSAFTHLLLAAVTQAAQAGITKPRLRNAAKALRSDVDAPTPIDELRQLPGSAAAAARSLREHRAFFEKAGTPPELIEYVLARLEAEADEDLASRLQALPAGERLAESRRLMHKDLHKH